ncbi:MAG: HAMP domain-containing sensor histidine kinase [Pseudomonadota bacterium]
MSVSTLAAVVVACSVLLLWNTYSATYNQKRTSLAYEELTGYLSLSSEVLGTFKRVRRDLLNEGGTLTFDLGEAQARITKIVAGINQTATVENEVGLRAGEVDEDLQRARDLAKELQNAFADVRQTELLLKNGRVEEARQFLDKSLKTRLDGVVTGFINDAVEDERSELDDALREIEYYNTVAYWAAILASLIGVLVAGWAMYALALRMSNSLRNLENGAELFASGKLNHTIPITGRDEFAKLSGRFNAMAGQLQTQRTALEEARDQLEQRVMERTDELQIANDELRRRDETRRQFFADIGHELRTPITAVRGEAEVALRARQKQRETYHSALSRIIAISDQLTRFVNDIFLIAREQAGVVDMRHSVIDLRGPVADAVEQLHSKFEQDQCRLAMDLGDEIVPVEGDAQRLCQLMLILMLNAIEHSPPGVSIKVSLAGHDDEWRLSVEDNGPGISDEDASHAFERFYRGSVGAGPEQHKSTGLGLPIARSITNAHGGRIWIDTAFSGGTAVRIALPVIEQHPDEPEPEAHAEMETVN